MNEDILNTIQTAIESLEAARVHMLSIDPQPKSQERQKLDEAYRAAGAAAASMRQLIELQR